MAGRQGAEDPSYPLDRRVDDAPMRDNTKVLTAFFHRSDTIAVADEQQPPHVTRSVGTVDNAEQVAGTAPSTEAAHAREVAATPAWIARQSSDHHSRWIFDSVLDTYPRLLDSGPRVQRCHDVSLAERILQTRAGNGGVPVHTPAVVARAAGRPVPADRPRRTPHSAGEDQPLLFDSGPDTAVPITARDVHAAYTDQMSRLEDSAHGPVATAAGISVDPRALRLLIAAESGSALVAAEMSRRGLPWDSAEHDRILTGLLGARPVGDQRPPALADLQRRICAEFGFEINPDSPQEVKEAFVRSGFELESTRSVVLQQLDHPAVAPLLRYKELSRLYTANGWHWLDEWVSSEGRLAAHFLPGAVVSGRWATDGGGGLQLPAAIRRAAVAKPGHQLVVADAAQLEPRILAARSADAALSALASGDDLYSALAADGFGGDRRHAKLAMLGAMYGQTSGEAARLMATMRVRYPKAVGFVERAAHRGESGLVVASVLGRACPPPSTAWRQIVAGASGEGMTAGPGGASSAARRTARDRGRFTRNFVIQASAADWAAVWMTSLRLALLDAVPLAEMVLFQHDELVVHVPSGGAHQVAEIMTYTARQATELVFPGSPVLIPVRPQIVRSYADAQ